MGSTSLDWTPEQAEGGRTGQSPTLLWKCHVTGLLVAYVMPLGSIFRLEIKYLDYHFVN